MKIAVVAQGAMGAGTGAALVDHGAEVVTSLAGRSAASARRAEVARMRPVSDAELASADIILSIVPPGEALLFAERMAPHLKAVATKPLFVDCNAVSPATVAKISKVVASTGAGFVDAGIIGGPPRRGGDGPYCGPCMTATFEFNGEWRHSNDESMTNSRGTNKEWEGGMASFAERFDSWDGKRATRHTAVR